MARAYCIKKRMVKNDVVTYILLNDGHSEVLEYSENNKVIGEKFVEVLNSNTDNGCSYELIPIG